MYTSDITGRLLQPHRSPVMVFPGRWLYRRGVWPGGRTSGWAPAGGDGVRRESVSAGATACGRGGARGGSADGCAGLACGARASWGGVEDG